MEDFKFMQLEVWKRSVKLARKIFLWLDELKLDRKHYKLVEQIEASSTSVFQNIAEGYGRGSTREFIHFLRISRGSLYETASVIWFFKEISWMDEQTFNDFFSECKSIARMLNGLIRKLNTNVRRKK